MHWLRCPLMPLQRPHGPPHTDTPLPRDLSDPHLVPGRILLTHLPIRAPPWQRPWLDQVPGGLRPHVLWSRICRTPLSDNRVAKM